MPGITSIYINHLKPLAPILVMLVALMCDFHISAKTKNMLDHISMCNSLFDVIKMLFYFYFYLFIYLFIFFFITNFEGWKLECNRLGGDKWNEQSLTVPKSKGVKTYKELTRES